MGKIIKDGVEYPFGGGGAAASTTYNNSTSGLTATNTQDAIDELAGNAEKINIYVGEDGKLHFVDAGGADSVLPFSGSAGDSFKIISLGSKTFRGFSGTVSATIDVTSYYENYTELTIDNFIIPNCSSWAGYNYSASGVIYSNSFNSKSYNELTGILTVVFNVSGKNGSSGNYDNYITVPFYLIVPAASDSEDETVSGAARLVYLGSGTASKTIDVSQYTSVYGSLTVNNFLISTKDATVSWSQGGSAANSLNGSFNRSVSLSKAYDSATGQLTITKSSGGYCSLSGDPWMNSSDAISYDVYMLESGAVDGKLKCLSFDKIFREHYSAGVYSYNDTMSFAVNEGTTKIVITNTEATADNFYYQIGTNDKVTVAAGNAVTLTSADFSAGDSITIGVDTPIYTSQNQTYAKATIYIYYADALLTDLVLVGEVAGGYQTTVDCTHLANYESLTADDFFYEPTGVGGGAYSTGDQSSSIEVVKSYDASTGKLTLTHGYNHVDKCIYYYTSGNVYLLKKVGRTSGSTSESQDPVLLWTNPSPLSSFAAQTISLDLSEYSSIIIETLYEATTPSGYIGTASKSIIPVDGVEYKYPNPYYGMTRFGRSIKCSSTGVYITSAANSENDRTLPYKIYGVKFALTTYPN